MHDAVEPVVRSVFIAPLDGPSQLGQIDGWKQSADYLLKAYSDKKYADAAQKASTGAPNALGTAVQQLAILSALLQKDHELYSSKPADAWAEASAAVTPYTNGDNHNKLVN